MEFAEKHHGKAELAKRLVEHGGDKSPKLKAQKDDRRLAAMAQAVFPAGCPWDVVEKKWPGFEAAFKLSTPHRDVIRILSQSVGPGA